MVHMDASAETILEGLDDAQRAAATTVNGPVRIIAGAGAGKTRTVTRRIAYACATGEWDPRRALLRKGRSGNVFQTVATRSRRRGQGRNVPFRGIASNPSRMARPVRRTVSAHQQAAKGISGAFAAQSHHHAGR